MIEIANVRALPPPSEWGPWVVYVGRAAPRKGFNASPLANPYAVGRFRGFPVTREDAVELYHGYFSHARRNGSPVEPELDRLRALLKEHGRLTLACWCENWNGEGPAPGRCHAEVIKEVLESAERSA